MKHDTGELPLSDRVRATKDAIEKPLAQVGILKTVTRLRGYRQDFLDERGGMATTASMVEESGALTLLVVRLKVVDRKITVIEMVATRSRSERLIFNVDGLSAPSQVMNYALRPEQLASREEALKAALHYPEGLNAAKKIRRREGALHTERVPVRERTDYGRTGLQVRAGLPEYLHAVARHLQPPGQSHDARCGRRRADGHRLIAPQLGRARAYG